MKCCAFVEQVSINQEKAVYNSVKETNRKCLTMKNWNREIYYYDTASNFETEKFAGRFLKMVYQEMRNQEKSGVLFFCIGTDRSTGDSLGPLIGYKLTKHGMKHAKIMGTLDDPVHATNMEDCLRRARRLFHDSVIVAVDASVGNREHVGYVTLGRGPLKPGLGVKKEMDAVGDLFVTGVVGSVKHGDPLMLQSVRLSVVMRMADCISNGILLGMNANPRLFQEKSVDKFVRMVSSL